MRECVLACLHVRACVRACLLACACVRVCVRVCMGVCSSRLSPCATRDFSLPDFVHEVQEYVEPLLGAYNRVRKHSTVLCLTHFAMKQACPLTELMRTTSHYPRAGSTNSVLPVLDRAPAQPPLSPTPPISPTPQAGWLFFE